MESVQGDVTARLGWAMGAWTVVFLVVRFLLCPRRSADFGNRVVSIAHALAAIALAIPALEPLSTVGMANTAAQARAKGHRAVPSLHSLRVTPTADALHGV